MQLVLKEKYQVLREIPSISLCFPSNIWIHFNHFHVHITDFPRQCEWVVGFFYQELEPHIVIVGYHHYTFRKQLSLPFRIINWTHFVFP